MILKKMYITAIIFIVALSSCDVFENENKNPVSSKQNMIQRNGTISWIEEIVDSTTLPQSLNNLSIEEKRLYINKNTQRWQVIITVPDTNIKEFRVERILLDIAARDTTVSPSRQIWRTVYYNGTIQNYDKYDNLMNSTYIQPTSDEADISTIPLTHTDDIVLSDSLVNIFKTALEANGETVEEIGNQIKSSITKVEDGNTFNYYCYFDKDYFLPQVMKRYISGDLIFQIKFSYLQSNGYRICNKIIENSKIRPSIGTQAKATAELKNSIGDYTGIDELETVTITTYSNITY